MTEKKENETWLQFADRILSAKESGILDLDRCEIYALLFGESLSSDESRKRLYAVRSVIDILRREQLGNISEQDILAEIISRQQELQKEKYKVQTEKIALNQMLREQARFELFVETAVAAIKKHCNIQVNIHPIHTEYNKREGLLIFADSHYGKEFKITGLNGEIINEYSIEIFEDRMQRLLYHAVEIAERERFTKIKVFNLGDEVEGILRISQLMTLKLGIVDSTIAFAYFLAEWLNELSKYVGVDYYATQGNHTDLRLLTGKKGDFPHENMSKVIHAIIKEILRDNPNVIINDNCNDKIFTDIAGFKVLGIHGEERNKERAIRDFSYLYNEDIDYLCTGHKHHSNTTNVGISKGCIGVGSIMGVDDFAIQLKKVNNPTSTFVVFEEGVGKTVEYTIYLD